MKVNLHCIECWKAGLGDVRVSVSVQDSNMYVIVCPIGHRTGLRVVNLKYELLFEAGLAALGDGYYREAVVNFAASLERYLEFTITALLNYRNNLFDEDEFEKIWKSLSNSSERQLGAFWMLYFEAFNQAPPLLDSKFLREFDIQLEVSGNEPTTFRNNTVHKGAFASYNQAVSYGEAVRLYMVRVMELGFAFSPEVKPTDKNQVSGLSSYYFAVMKAGAFPPNGFNDRALASFERYKRENKLDQIGSIALPTFFNLMQPSSGYLIQMKRSVFERFPLK